MPQLIKKYRKNQIYYYQRRTRKKNLEKLAVDLDVEEHVFFAGRVSRELVVEYLKISDVFVLNTNYEGMSHVLLEAMKVGTPIITTKAGGNPETIKDEETGLLVDYRDGEQWIEAINNILDNKDLAEKLVKQAKDDLERFNWDNLVKETIRVFENV